MIGRRLQRYILDADGEPRAVDDLMTWARWLEHADADRVVLRDDNVRRGVDVSTVFLASDRRFSGSGPPILWETMIFGGAFNSYQRRYTSKLDAIAGHQRAVALVELYATAPRKTKHALGKIYAGARLGAREQRRVRRALRRL